MQLLFTFIILVVGVLGRVGPLPERDRHRACGPVRDGGGVEGDPKVRNHGEGPY